MLLRFICLLLSATLSAPWTTLAAQPSVETIRVGIPGKLVDFSAFFVGLKTGIYRSEGLEPQFIVMRSGIIFPALLAGELDYTTLYQSALRSAVSGLPVRVIATLITKQSFFLFSRPEIRRVQDLKASVWRSPTSPAPRTAARAPRSNIMGWNRSATPPCSPWVIPACVFRLWPPARSTRRS